MNPIAANIRARRAALGLRQAQVAEAAGCSQRLISKLEGEKSNPRAEELAHIARALETTAAALLEGYAQDVRKSAEIEQEAPKTKAKTTSTRGSLTPSKAPAPAKATAPTPKRPRKTKATTTTAAA